MGTDPKLLSRSLKSPSHSIFGDGRLTSHLSIGLACSLLLVAVSINEYISAEFCNVFRRIILPSQPTQSDNSCMSVAPLHLIPEKL